MLWAVLLMNSWRTFADIPIFEGCALKKAIFRAKDQDRTLSGRAIDGKSAKGGIPQILSKLQ